MQTRTADNLYLIAYRLSCYDDFAELIPDSFSSLLPPEPLPSFKFSSEDDSKCTCTHFLVLCVRGNTFVQTVQSDPLPESAVASQLLEAIRSKESAEKLSEVLDSLISLAPDSE